VCNEIHQPLCQSEKDAQMLVLSRKSNETIVINNNIKVTVVEIRGDKVRLGIVAPKEIPVHRQEVFDLIHSQASDDSVAPAQNS
jgi:carbon storage regulator